MKIAYVCPYYAPAIGGVKQVVQELAERLVKDGHEVHVFTSDSDKVGRVNPKNEIINGVRVHRCYNWFTLVNFATIWPSGFWKLYKGKFDVIHSHLAGHLHVFIASLVSRLKKVPHIHTTHCPWSEGNRSLLGRTMMWLDYHTVLPLTFAWSERIIAITPWEIDYIKKYGGREDKITVIPNGLFESLYERVENNSFKKRLGIKDKMVLFFGRLSPTKAPDFLAKAGKEIVKERSDVDFVFLGPDEGLKEKIKEMVKDEDRMHLLEPIRNKRKIAEMYQAADVYSLASYREGLPLTLFEAMASGVPIIATPVNGIPYEMKDPVNGVLVPFGDVKALKRGINKLLDDKEYAKQVVKNNLKKSENFTWNKIKERTEQVYKEEIFKKMRN